MSWVQWAAGEKCSISLQARRAAGFLASSSSEPPAGAADVELAAPPPAGAAAYEVAWVPDADADRAVADAAAAAARVARSAGGAGGGRVLVMTRPRRRRAAARGGATSGGGSAASSAVDASWAHTEDLAREQHLSSVLAPGGSSHGCSAVLWCVGAACLLAGMGGSGHISACRGWRGGGHISA